MRGQFRFRCPERPALAAELDGCTERRSSPWPCWAQPSRPRPAVWPSRRTALRHPRPRPDCPGHPVATRRTPDRRSCRVPRSRRWRPCLPGLGPGPGPPLPRPHGARTTEPVWRRHRYGTGTRPPHGPARTPPYGGAPPYRRPGPPRASGPGTASEARDPAVRHRGECVRTGRRLRTLAAGQPPGADLPPDVRTVTRRSRARTGTGGPATGSTGTAGCAHTRPGDAPPRARHSPHAPRAERPASDLSGEHPPPAPTPAATPVARWLPVRRLRSRRRPARPLRCGRAADAGARPLCAPASDSRPRG